MNRRGFTILELLVASLLLGMLVTILTLIFNQSSVAWRTGTAGVADLDDVRDNMAELREEADNAFVCKGEVRRIVGLWDADGTFYDRACDAPNSSAYSDGSGRLQAQILGKGNPKSALCAPASSRKLWTSSGNMVSVGQQGSLKSIKSYTVNIKSAGPDRVLGTYDDIWSWPDAFE